MRWRRASSCRGWAGGPGTAPGLGPPARFDPDRARALLAEAGYPQGFRLTLHGPNDRYVNDGRIVQAAAQMFTRPVAGGHPGLRPIETKLDPVEVAVEALPWTTRPCPTTARAERGAGVQRVPGVLGREHRGDEQPAYEASAIMATPDKAAGLGIANDAGYSNPALDAKLKQAATGCAPWMTGRGMRCWRRRARSGSGIWRSCRVASRGLGLGGAEGPDLCPARADQYTAGHRGWAGLMPNSRSSGGAGGGDLRSGSDRDVREPGGPAVSLCAVCAARRWALWRVEGRKVELLVAVHGTSRTSFLDFRDGFLPGSGGGTTWRS